MENLSEVSGYVASTLVLFTFVAKDMRLLRTIAIFSNLAFITYATIEWLPPVLFLHLVLLPLNIVRLAEVIRETRSTSDLSQADGVMITCGTIEWLPVLFLHLVLLPLNIVRLAEVVSATRSTGDPPQADGVMDVQPLGADLTSPLALWPIFPSTPKISRPV